MKRDGRGLDHRTLEAIRMMAVERDCGIAAGRWGEGAALQAGDRAATQFDAGSGATGVSLDQWPGPASVWSGLWIVDAICGRRADRAEVRHPAWRDRGGGIACQAGTDAAKAAA